MTRLGLSNYLAIATVADGGRPCGRLVVDRELAGPLTQRLHALGLAHRLASFNLREGADAVPGTSHRGAFVPRDDDARHVVYFAGKDEYCDGAELAELHANHELAGRLFGYPDCCVTRFARTRQAELDRWPSLFRRKGPFPRILNPVSFYVYGVPNLVFHFPCSPDCRASTAIAEDCRSRLARLVGKPNVLRRVGRGLALYGPEIGIGLATRYARVSPRTFLLRRIDTRSAETADVFRADGVLRLIDRGAVQIGGRTFADPCQFVAEFE